MNSCLARTLLSIVASISVAFPTDVAAADAATSARTANVSPANGVTRGRYIAIVGGCNDCHTPGYAPSGGKVPEAEWLKGDGILGFRGPWGTTYAPNLRIIAASMSENEWVKYSKELKTRPPMPYFNVNAMSEGDLRALHRYIRSLGVPGQPVMTFVPPDKEPKGPVILWPSPPK